MEKAVTSPDTHTALVEVVARAIERDICQTGAQQEHGYLVLSNGGDGNITVRGHIYLHALVDTALAAIRDAGLAVVPQEADERLGYIGGTAFEDAAFANQKIVFHATQDVWRTMVAAADLASEKPE